MNQSQSDSRPLFDAWLRDFVSTRSTANIDTALREYTRKYQLVIRESLDEPPQITDARTRLAVLEESGLLDPADTQAVDLRRYADALRSNLRMYEYMSPEARASLARGVSRPVSWWERLLLVLAYATASALAILCATHLSIWLLLGGLCAALAYKLAISRNDFTPRMAIWLSILVGIVAFMVGRNWYWSSSPLVPAMRKCEELRELWTQGKRLEAINAIEDIATNQQPWEKSGWDGE